MKNLSAIASSLPILLAVLLSASAYVLPSSEGGVGSHCRLPNGGRGSCRLVTDCPPALDAVRHGTRRGTHGELARCGFQGSVEIVCCGDGGRGTGVRRQSVSGGRRTGPSRKPETEWLGTPGRGGSPRQTLSETKSMSACRYYTTNCPKSVSPYITGGSTAQRGEFPHMAAIGYPSMEQGNNISWDCGGTLISDRYVMTAAHCTSVSNRKPVVVRLGELDLSTDEDDATPVDFSIEKVHIHPSYKSGPLYHDLALLRLNKQVKFTEFICPACLYPGSTSSPVASGGDRNDLTDRILADGEEIGPRINDEVDLRERQLTVSGWGRTTHLGDKSPILQKANLKPYSIENCGRNLTQATGRSANSFMPQGLMQSLMLCAGDPTGKQDTCQGDSGGPLQYQPEDSPIYTVIGITSFGDKCGFSVPSVYTRVSSYLEWIEGIVWPGAPPS